MSQRRALLLLSALALASSGCGGSTLDADQSACAQLICQVGVCEVHGGVPRCACSAFEQAAGAQCDVPPLQQRETSDEGNTLETAVVLQPSEQGLEATLTLKPDFSQDEDYYVLAHQPDHYYDVWCERDTLEVCELRVLGGWPYDLRRPYPDTRPGVWEFKAVEGSPMHLHISAPYGVKGSYVLHARDLGRDEHGDSYETATPLEGTGALDGRLESRNDQDYFTLKVIKGHAYYVSLSAELGLGIAGAKFSERAFFAEASGLHHIVVASDEGAPQSYALRFEDRGPDDHPDAEASPLEPGAPPQSGRLETGTDKDVFAFTPPGNDHYYRLRCILSTGARCDLSVAPLAVSPSLPQPEDGWVFKGQAYPEGSWAGQVVRLTVFASGAPQGASYTLSLEDLGADDFPDQEQGGAKLAPGTYAGRLELTGDRDHFEVQGKWGGVYQVRCDCTVLSRMDNSPYWYELKTYGTTEPPRVDLQREVTFPLLVIGASSAAYTLVVEEEPWTDDYVDSYSTDPVPLGTALPGIIEYANDEDAHTFDLTPGEPRVLELVGEGDLTLTVWGLGQSTQTYFRGAGAHAFTPTEGSYGEYRILVSSAGPYPKAYKLTVR